MAATILQRIEDLCKAKVIRMTKQRRIIAHVIANSSDHPDIAELHKRASVIDSKISIATVYRSVRFLEEAGILSRRSFDSGSTRYEEADRSHHDHLIDLSSGLVIEFHNEKIEQLQKQIAKELGYHLINHRLDLYGMPIITKKPKTK